MLTLPPTGCSVAATELTGEKRIIAISGFRMCYDVSEIGDNNDRNKFGTAGYNFAGLQSKFERIKVKPSFTIDQIST